MKIETRFDLDQLVYRVGRIQHTDSEQCAACGGSGRLAVTRLDGSEQKSYCEACNGRGRIKEVWYDLYEIIDQSRIGQITVKYTRKPYFKGDPKVEEAYMIDSTGVGSGTVHALRDEVWTHSHLFATEREALDFCAAENPALLAAVDEKKGAVRGGGNAMTFRRGILVGLAGVCLTGLAVLWLVDRCCEAGRL